MTEREMEDLIAAYPKEFFGGKDMVLKGRQGSFAGVGRFDLLFEDEHHTNVLMELKAVAARYEHASQLARYKAALDESGDRYVLMWLVAPLIPKPVRDFLDQIGIEYSEIHEATFKTVAARHGIKLEERPLPPEGPVPPRNPGTKNASDFLARCDDSGKVFFSAFFSHQKTLAKTRITWDHVTGFSMHFYFRRLGHVPMIWGLPSVNRDGVPGSHRQCLVFPFDIAAKKGVPEDFLNSFGQALADVTSFTGGSKRPSIPVSALSPKEVSDILSVISLYVEKAASV